MTTETPAHLAEDVILTLNDVQNAILVIDHAADQGAFKGWKAIEQVLFVRQRLNNYVNAVSPPAAATDATPEVSA